MSIYFCSWGTTIESTNNIVVTCVICKKDVDVLCGRDEEIERMLHERDWKTIRRVHRRHDLHLTR